MRRQVLAAYRGYPAGDVFTGMLAGVSWHHAALTPAGPPRCATSTTRTGPAARTGHVLVSIHRRCCPQQTSSRARHFNLSAGGQPGYA